MSELIVLCPNPYRDCGLELTKKAVDILHSGGYEAAVCPVFGAHDAEVIPNDVELTAWSTVTERASAEMAPFCTLQGILTTLRFPCLE